MIIEVTEAGFVGKLLAAEGDTVEVRNGFRALITRNRGSRGHAEASLRMGCYMIVHELKLQSTLLHGIDTTLLYRQRM